MILAIEAVNRALARQLDRLLPELLGGGPERSGREWLAGHRSAGFPGDSLRVVLHGEKRGQWYWHLEGRGGDPLGLIAALRANDDMGAAFKWARDWLGGDIEGLADDPAAAQRRQAAAERAERERQRREAAIIGFARDIWRETQPLAGTPADFYLQGRGLDLRGLPRWPGDLRFHGALEHPGLGALLPALVAAVRCGRTGQLMAVHRTWLQDAAGRWDRLRREDVPARMALGPVGGHCIHVWAPEGVTWLGAAGATAIGATEGIEDALTIALACPWRALVAAISLGNLAALVLPPQVRALVWYGDQDGDNEAALRALARGCRAHLDAGRTVRLRRPAGAKDWNEARIKVARHA